MFKTIIWATDGSEAAAVALPYALSLGEPDGSKIVVAHARELIVGRGGGYPVFADDEELQHKLEQQVRELCRAGIDATLEVRTCVNDHAARTIAEIAEEAGADLIVVGTHGHSRVGAFMIGSITQQLLKLGVCPVLAVPPGVLVGAAG